MITCRRCGTENAAAARFCSACGNALLEPTAAVEVRKTVTVMFMDAVGSTGLGESADPESLRRVMTRYFDEIRTIVERHGGVVEKYIGDAVMAVFGVPAVHEDDALRAVRAAIEIRSRLAELDQQLQRERGLAIAWRTGINTGEVVAGDAGAGQRFVTGDAVNVAARLEQSAGAAEILLGAQTYELLRDAIDAQPAAPVAAKGKSEPVAAYRLIDLTATAPFPTRSLDSPMVGRQRQRRLLAEAYEQVVDERVCHLFTILGAAGVGKSRLTSEFVTSLGDTALVLHGRCLSYGEGISYWPIAEAVREAAGLTENDDEESIRRKVGPLIDDERDRPQVVERLGELLGRFAGVGATEETFWAVRTLLESVARRRPLVLILDDVHWAEPTLLDLIEHLADWTRDAPLLLLCVARQDLLEVRPGWGGGKSYATTLTLEPLNDTESRELMVNLLGQVELSAEVVDKIAAAAEGNPLFVEEMLGMLIDGGYIERRDGGWTATASLTRVSVPPTIQALLAARLDRLPVPERAVIERGAVEGKIFHRSAVAELAPESLRESVPEHLRALSRKELVRPDRSDFAGDEAFRFRHLLIRDAAYAAMPKEARAELHARFAQWLERVAADHLTEYEEILGYHLEQSYRYRLELGPPDDEARQIGISAADHLGAAGERALERGDIHAATKLLTSAVELTSQDDPRRSLLVAKSGLALLLAGELRRADSLLADAIEGASSAGDELGRARAEVVRLDTLGSLGQVAVEEVIRRSEELLAVFERYGDEWGIDHATVELARHQFFAGRARVAEEILAAQIARYQPGEVPRQLIGFLMAARYWGPTPVGEAMRSAEELLAANTSRGIEPILFRTLGGLHAMVGDFDEGRALLRRAIAIDEDLGRRVMVNSLYGHFLGPLELLACNYDEAERVLLDAYGAMTETGDQAFSSTVAGYLAELYVALGRFEDAERYARITLDTAQPDDVESQAQGFSALARVRAAEGDVQTAETMARRAVEIAEQTDYLIRRGSVLADLAEVLLAAGRPVDAAEALRRALKNFDAKGATVQAGRVRRRLDEITGRAGQWRG
jgi:class 3 adenylate cyclase/tetratricopeptide (TPR) repeat protein